MSDNALQESNKAIAASIQGKIRFQPIDNRVLVKPLKEVKLKKTVTELDDEANKGRDLMKEEAITKTSVKEVPANFRKGIVLSIGTGVVDVPFEVGDTVFYPRNAGVDFDLFKDSRLLQRYEIVGKLPTE